jgi:hypothetical protein
VHSVDFDVCAWIAAAFYIGIVLRENAFGARLYLIAEQIAARFTTKQPRLYPIWRAQQAEPSWEGRGRREFSELLQVD